jgi:hypothetical protein
VPSFRIASINSFFLVNRSRERVSIRVCKLNILHERMERLVGDHGYVPMDHRELRFSFKPPRDLLDPDLAIANAQLARGDRQMLNEAKKNEHAQRKVWFFLTFPANSTTGEKRVNKMVKVDLLIATPFGAMVIKVLDWSGTCSTTPGEKWIERRSDGSKIEHANQLAELDETTQWVRAFLESKSVCPKVIASYVLFTSPHAKPSFTSDPRIVVGPAACSALVTGNGLSLELAETKSYVEWGQSAVINVVNKIRRPSDVDKAGVSKTIASVDTTWLKLQACLDGIPQFDLLLLRKNGCFLFGRLEKFEDAVGEKPGTARSLERLCNRNPARFFHFEHSVGGLIGAPLAFISGGLGWEPMCRVRNIQAPLVEAAGANRVSLSSIDVSPKTRLLFRVFGCEGLVSAELNDIDALELAKVPRSLTGNDEVGGDMVDQIGQMIGGVLTKSIQVGVKNMLPFPLNNLVT